jgi:RNA polymerase sigma-70 factor (ECF subfamily)
LKEWNAGDEAAFDALTPVLYKDLRVLARYYMNAERSGHTLQPTALVHEVFLRLFDQCNIKWQSREHFLAIAAKLMRRVLVEHARRKRAAKRQPEDFFSTAIELRADEILAVNQALERLAQSDPRKVAVVEYRYLAGMTLAETAQALNISEASVTRDWTLAKAWLFRELNTAPRM